MLLGALTISGLVWAEFRRDSDIAPPSTIELGAATQRPEKDYPAPAIKSMSQSVPAPAADPEPPEAPTTVAAATGAAGGRTDVEMTEEESGAVSTDSSPVEIPADDAHATKAAPQSPQRPAERGANWEAPDEEVPRQNRDTTGTAIHEESADSIRETPYLVSDSAESDAQGPLEPEIPKTETLDVETPDGTATVAVTESPSALDTSVLEKARTPKFGQDVAVGPKLQAALKEPVNVEFEDITVGEILQFVEKSFDIDVQYLPVLARSSPCN